MRKLLLIIFFLCLYITKAITQPTANFGSNLTKGCGAVQIIFFDSSTVSNGSIVSWKWDLAGVTSEKQNPGKIFDKPGSFTICLEVTDNVGRTDKICKENYINIFDKPKADFTIDRTSGCVPFTINFVNLSTSTNGAISQWTWDIGGTANVIITQDPTQNISTTYHTQGAKSATLTIKDDKGCEASVSKKDIIIVNAVPEVVLSKDYINTCDLPWSVQLKNENADPAATYKWNLGNGVQYNGLQPPLAVFTEKKSYDLTIEVQKGLCKDTIEFLSYINANPKTQIEFEKQEFCFGEEIYLKDASELGADSVYWNLGDGQFSKERNVRHTYAKAGCYQVILYRFRGNCSDTLIYNCVNVLEVPKPSYLITNQFTCFVPVNVTMTGNSTGTYNWTVTSNNFDTSFNTAQGSFTINEFNDYVVQIQFVDEKGCKAEVFDTIKIKKFEAVLPNDKIGGCIPYDVLLQDSIETDIPITKWQWTIGNPAIISSTLKNPKFRLNEVGLFDVTLVVTNAFGCIDTIFIPEYIGGGTPPDVDFVASPIEDCLAVERTFTDLSSSNANFWIWNFGDESTGTGKEVKHSYSNPGGYDVSLTAMHNGCASSLTKPLYINVLEPVSNYAIEYNCVDPFTVALNNLSLGADSLYWEIFDGSSRDTIRDSILTTYTFPGRGEYTIKIYSKNFTTGCEHIRLDTIILTDPVAAFTVDTTKGCVPLEINFIDLSIDANVTKYYFGTEDTIAGDSFIYEIGGIQKPPYIHITDIHGCVDTFELDTIIYANAIAPMLDFPGIACVPQVVSISDISRDSFATIVDWKWQMIDSIYEDSNQISVNIDVAKSYDIFLFVEDDWGCKDSVVVKNAIEAILLQPDFKADSLGCTNTDLLFHPIGDNINTSEYIWTFGDGSESNTSVAKHRYTDEGRFDICLTLKDVRGCENSICKPQWIDIRDPKADFFGNPTEEICPPLLTNFTNMSLNAGNFQWDFGDNTGFSYVEHPSHIYSEPDSFDVTLIAIRSEACKDTIKFVDYIKVLGPKGTFNYSITGNCIPLLVEFQATSEDYYSYQWDFGNGDIDSSLTLSISETKNYVYTRPGVYSAKLIIKDNNGCARNFVQDDIVVNDISIAASIEDQLYCGLPAQINIQNNSTSSSNITRYDWKLYANGDSIIFPGTPFISTNINTYGQYDVRLTATTENCVVDTIIENMLNVQPVPVADFNFVKPAYCENESIALINNSSIASGNIVKNLWFINNESIESKDLDYTFENRGDKNVKLSVTSEHGCVNEITKKIVVHPTSTAELIPDTVICLDQHIDFTPVIKNATGNNFVEWYEDGVKSCDDCDTYRINPGDTSVLIYVVNNEFGCHFADTLTVNLAPVYPPEITLGADTVLCLNTIAKLEVKDYNSAYVYNWSSSQAFSCHDDCRSITTKVSTPAYYYAKATNVYHCYTSDTIYASVETTVPDFLIDEKYICADATTVLKISDYTGLKWYEKNQILCENCDSLTVNPEKEQYYFSEIESDYGCIYTDSIFVKLVPLTSVDAGNDLQICLGETKTLIGKGIGNGNWKFAGNDIGSGHILSHSPKQSGYYIFEATKDECSIQDSLYIDVLIKSTIQAIGDTVCFGDSAFVSADGLATHYNWLYQNSSFQSNKNAFDFLPEQTMTLLVIGSRTTCIPDSQEVLVYVHPKIDYTLKEDKYLVYFNSIAKIEADYNTNANYLYEWSPSAGLSCDDCPTPTIKDLEKSTAFVLNITDAQSNCAVERSLEARLSEECSKEGYFIPNIFIPNSNTANDFLLKTVYPQDFRSISILDRWGNKIFSSHDVNFTWDGRFNGKSIESGVYIYFVTAFCPELNKEFVFSGDVTILK